MQIGYGSVSVYDSIRYDLYLDTNTNKAFFIDVVGKQYIIQLNDEYIQFINRHKKLWVTLTNLTPTQIKENKIDEFKNPIIDVLECEF